MDLGSVSLKTLIDTGRGDLLSGEMGLTGQSDLSTKQKMLIQVSSTAVEAAVTDPP